MAQDPVDNAKKSRSLSHRIFEVVSKNVENMSRVREKLVAESRGVLSETTFFLAAFGEKIQVEKRAEIVECKKSPKSQVENEGHDSRCSCVKGRM
jgi:hypothetical protein